MLTLHKLIPQGRGLAPVLVKRAASVELDWDVRQKSRWGATDSQGRAIGVFLPRGTSPPRRRPCCASRRARCTARPST